MASTLTLQNSINWAQANIRFAPLTGLGGLTNEPALSMGNYVRQFITGPPFAWRWNRATTTFSTVAGTQDYAAALPSFGWLEKAAVNDGTAIHELNVMNNLADNTQQDLPIAIAARLDDGAGNITFRLQPVPSGVFTVSISYQKSVANFASLTDTWAPIPDYLSFLFHQGVVAKAYEYADDDRFPMSMNLFLKQLVASNEGLSEAQVSIFLPDRMNILRTSQVAGAKMQSAVGGRGGL